MVNLSLNQANNIFGIANLALIIGAALVFIGTLIAIWTGSVRERYANERVSTNELETARAKADAAQANLKTAELEQQNIEMKEKFSNRRITKEQHEILIHELSGHRATFNMKVMADPESSFFASDILRTFHDAGWTIGSKELPLGEMWMGLVVLQTKDSNLVFVMDALRKANIPFQIGDQITEKVTIVVGGKPPFF